MARLGMRRDSSRDFSWADGARTWHGLVWVARAPAHTAEEPSSSLA
jgi:hypothetical protein